MPMSASDRASVLRDAGRELLAKADALDGEQPCTCGHTRTSHDPAGWNEGWCDGHLIALGHEKDAPPEGEVCECEEFTAW